MSKDGAGRIDDWPSNEDVTRTAMPTSASTFIHSPFGDWNETPYRRRGGGLERGVAWREYRAGWKRELAAAMLDCYCQEMGGMTRLALCLVLGASSLFAQKPGWQPSPG